MEVSLDLVLGLLNGKQEHRLLKAKNAGRMPALQHERKKETPRGFARRSTQQKYYTATTMRSKSKKLGQKKVKTRSLKTEGYGTPPASRPPARKRT
jgi:hypothetical protein